MGSGGWAEARRYEGMSLGEGGYSQGSGWPRKSEVLLGGWVGSGGAAADGFGEGLFDGRTEDRFTGQAAEIGGNLALVVDNEDARDAVDIEFCHQAAVGRIVGINVLDVNIAFVLVFKPIHDGYLHFADRSPIGIEHDDADVPIAVGILGEAGGGGGGLIADDAEADHSDEGEQRDQSQDDAADAG